MKTSNTKIIGQTFQKIADLVTPTMGAKGRLAVINQEMDRPLLTDDGVTVARECYSLKDFEQIPTLSVIEAASNTEKRAFDGTTLTVQLVNELYKQGLKWTKPKILGGLGLHPQQAADKLLEQVEQIRLSLKNTECFPMKKAHVKNLSYIVTKIPKIGDLVTKAYEIAGSDMNVVIEHDRKIPDTVVEHTQGIALESGYMDEALRTYANEGSKTVFKDARLVLLSEGLLTPTMIKNFFMSVPAAEVSTPMVFVVTPKFNPESLKFLLDLLTSQQGKINFQFIFLREEHTEELYLDIAAFTGGKIQNAAMGTSDYLWEHCGYADHIEIEQNKSYIHASGDTSDRIASYQEALDNHVYDLSMNKEAMIRRRLSSLKSGLVKIKLACATVTEYMTIRLKLDDAIGAVRNAARDGLVLGGGRALANISFYKRQAALRTVLRKPMLTILQNAGLSKRQAMKVLLSDTCAIFDVVSMKKIMVQHLKDATIIDSFTAIDTALSNAVSIAASYLRAYILIRK